MLKATSVPATASAVGGGGGVNNSVLALPPPPNKLLRKLMARSESDNNQAEPQPLAAPAHTQPARTQTQGQPSRGGRWLLAPASGLAAFSVATIACVNRKVLCANLKNYRPVATMDTLAIPQINSRRWRVPNHSQYIASFEIKNKRLVICLSDRQKTHSARRKLGRVLG
jgi:hypothetical protein